MALHFCDLVRRLEAEHPHMLTRDSKLRVHRFALTVPYGAGDLLDNMAARVNRCQKVLVPGLAPNNNAGPKTHQSKGDRIEQMNRWSTVHRDEITRHQESP